MLSDSTATRIRTDAVLGTLARWLLPVGWLFTLVGYLGPWVVHPTAALSLTGADIGEFVKFLPGVQEGTLTVTRQAFYLPPFVVAVTLALLGSRPRLGYPVWIRIAGLVTGVYASLQLLPPAWSPSGLLSAEFRLQTLALAVSWLLLASCRWLGGVPRWLVALPSALLASIGLGLTLWQFALAKPAIGLVYAAQPSTGWGLPFSVAGLALVTLTSALQLLAPHDRSPVSWMMQ